jgi:predicted dehydrogenase
VAAADPDGPARRRAGQLAGVPVYEEAADLLARSDIDAVVISAPTHLHAELGISAARAGKHIYIEKPLASAAAPARRLAEAVREAGITVAVGFNRRCHLLHRQAHDLIAGGAIGVVRAVLTAFCEPFAPESMPSWKRSRSTGGGVLLDLASHHADLLRWFLGDEVAEVHSHIGSRVTEQDTAWMRVKMRSGVAAHSFFSFQAGRVDFLEFVGEHGTLRVDRHRTSLSLRLARRFGYGVRSGFLLPGHKALAWRIARLVRPSYDPSYRAALFDFVRAVQGRPLRGAGLEDGLRSLEIVLAAEESSHAGRSAALPLQDF